MKNKTLARIVKRTFGFPTKEEMNESLRGLEAKFQGNESFEILKRFFADFFELIDTVDRSFEDYERTLYLRESSLTISSREMTALNEAIQAHADRQTAVLKRLHDTIRLLTESEESLRNKLAASDLEDGEMESLIAMVEYLVRSKIDSAKIQQSLYEEGLKICSVLSFRSLEMQLRSSLHHIVGSDIQMEIYFSGSLFEGKDTIEFYQCDAFNNALEGKRLSDLQDKSESQYLYIESPKGSGTLAILRLQMASGVDKIKASGHIERISPLIPSLSSTLENIKLLKEEKKKQHLESELGTIRLVQQTLLPPSKPYVQNGDLEMSGFYESATECGGDWWTYFRLKDGRHLILVGDVTGHGTGSAMVCAVVKGYCDSFIDRSQISPSDILKELNQVVYRIAKENNRVMTMSAIAIDTNLGKATFANAGHPLPILIQMQGDQNTSRSLVNSGAILGVNSEASYKEVSFEFGQGDRIVLYSDGLTECTNTQDEMYGENRLRRLLKGFDPVMSAADLNQAIVQDVRRFSMGESFKDDLTTVVIRNLSAPSQKDFQFNPQGTESKTQKAI